MAKPAPDRVRVSGPLAAFADGFLVDLVEQGYRLWPAQRHLYFLASVSRWMETEDVGVAELTPGVVERFVAERRRVGYRSRLCLEEPAPVAGAISAGLACFPPATASRSRLLSGCSRSFATICWWSVR